MERKIGEIFEYNGEWYQCVESKQDACTDCAFNPINSIGYNCSGSCAYKKVIFKKLEKVGEPYEFDGHLFQSYHTFAVPIFTENYATVREFGNNSKISIEIKQNKEDMEEKNWTLDDAIKHYDEIGKSSISQECSKKNHQVRDWLVELKQYKKHSNSEKIRKDLKPFDLQKAREGKPVCTRDGRKVRIICFDLKNDEYPIVAVITNNGKEDELYKYDINGINGTIGILDLMMLPEKKEGWVNVYDDTPIYDTKERAELCASTVEKHIATVKIEWEE